MPEATRRLIRAVACIDRVSAGKSRCARPPLPSTGSQRRPTATTSTSIKPSQNEGMARPAMEHSSRIADARTPRAAASTPSGMPTARATAKAEPASSSVAGSRSSTSPATP